MIELIASGVVALVWLGTPCQSFTSARKDDGFGPMPLRDSSHPLGLPDLNSRDAQAVQLGNKLLKVSLRLMRVAAHHKVPCVMENPWSSYMWQVPYVRDFLYDTNLCESDIKLRRVDFCRFGTPWRKYRLALRRNSRG